MINQFSIRVAGKWDHSYLSNGFIEPDGTFVEREYQADAKTTDPEWRAKILAAPKPFGAQGSKRLGQKAPLREDHDEIKIPVMAYYVTKKFRDHPDLARQLVETGDQGLVEGNTWHDNIWGNCTCGNRDGLHPRCETPGLNWLGIILMTVRAGLVLTEEEK